MRDLFRHRDFRLLLLGQSLSTVGDRIVIVALALYVTGIGSPSGALTSREVWNLRTTAAAASP